MPLKIAISGSTGLVGERTVKYFKAKGFKITRLVRPETRSRFEDTAISWSVHPPKINPYELEEHDVVIHLAGENISAGRWTRAFKKAILESRVDGTKFISETLARLKKPPKVFLCASAIGFYGSHPSEEEINETSASGNDFLAKVCQSWEKATEPAERAGIRVVCLRLGVVLSPQGGMLAKVLPIFKLGLGGVIGSGTQMMSWIAVDDIPVIMDYFVNSSEISGAVNVVTPNPVTNHDFTRALGAVLHKPALCPLPGFMVKLIFGEMGETLLLGGARVMPERLLKSGYQFQNPMMESTLKNYFL